MGFECLNGFPGPYIKFMLEKMSPKEFYDMCADRKKFNAKLFCVYGLTGGPLGDEIKLFEGIIDGNVVEPRGSSSLKLSFDTFFEPFGQNKTFGEMTDKEKDLCSHRAAAFRQLKAFLEKFY